MASLRTTIAFVTLLLFTYNAFFTYVIINITAGTNRDVFLVLLSLDYMIIFYFILQVAHELKFSKPEEDARRGRNRIKRRR